MGSLKNMPNPICEAFKNNRRRSKLFFTRSLSDTPDELQVLNCGSNNEILVSKVKDSVSEEIKNMLASVTDSYLHGEVTQDFELKTFKRDDGVLVPIATSTGQQQVTSLAFIASLVKIAKKNMDNKTSNFLRGGEFPLVMDAPFNNVDSIYVCAQRAPW